MTASPRFRTDPVPGYRNRLKEAERAAKQLGFQLMDHQAAFLESFTQFDGDTGQPLHSTGVLSLPRQNGKSAVAQVFMADEMEAHQSGAYGLYTAQTRTAAASRVKAFGKLLGYGKLTMGAGNERLVLPSGSLLEVMAPNAEGGHGESVDWAVLDECWAVQDVVIQGLLPAMSARPLSQLLVISTAGTMLSEVWNGYLEQGRAGDFCFWEWSIPDDGVITDEDLWADFMPALGTTVDRVKVRDAVRQMSLPEATRAFGNRTTAAGSEVLPSEWWEDTFSNAVPEPGLVLSIDAQADPHGGASIAAAWMVGGEPGEEAFHVDLVEQRPGESHGWVAKRVRELVQKHQAAGVGLDVRGVAGQLEPQLRAICDDHAIPLRKFGSRDRARADGFLFEMLADRRVTHSPAPVLETAVAGVQAKQAEDQWTFDRRTSLVDVTPVVSVSLALFTAYELEVLSPVPVIF